MPNAAAGFSLKIKQHAGGRLPKKWACVKGHSDILAPTVERAHHGLVERLEKPIEDTSGNYTRPYRAVDTLAVMLRRGSITVGMHQAARDFQGYFAAAHLETLRAANLFRTSKSSNGAELPLKIEAGREAVWRAICAVGGLSSPGGACLWHVVGLECSIKQWALEQGWAGRLVSQESASGILVAALGALEAHYRGR